MANKFLWPAPEGQIAIVCCSPNNLHTIQYDDKSWCPKVYTTLELKDEPTLNVYNSKIIKDVADCGFNVIMYPGSDLDKKWIEYTKQALEDCQEHGIKLISNSPILNYTDSFLNFNPNYKSRWPTSFVQQFKNHPALGGWMVKDEPKYKEWHNAQNSTASAAGGISQTAGKELGQLTSLTMERTIVDNYQAIKNTDPRHIAYMNLAVGETSQWIGEELTKYEDFLDEFIAKFDPPLLTFDFYPIKSNGDNGHRVDQDLFYKYLNIFANKSQQYGIPFWSYCLCLEHTVSETVEGTVKETVYPVPTEGMLRFEAFSALAFGAQGIVFWGFKQDYKAFCLNEKGEQIKDEHGFDTKRLVITDRRAPLDVYGNIDQDIWNAVKKITNEISRVHDCFYNCKMTSYELFNSKNTELLMNGKGGYDKIRVLGPFLMTHIETPDPEIKNSDGGTFIHEYIVIVSLNPFGEQKFQWLGVQTETTSHEGQGLSNLVTEFNKNDDNYDGYSDGNYKDEPQDTEIKWKEETLDPGGWIIIEI
ncbi:MAG: hypothetical protein ACI303_07880 [Lepagella sp.]